LCKDFDNFFDKFFKKPLFSVPKLFAEKSCYLSVDVSEGTRDIIVKAEIPGVEIEEIEVFQKTD
jgi:HSP20 family molecular chaperone IbpA